MASAKRGFKPNWPSCCCRPAPARTAAPPAWPQHPQAAGRLGLSAVAGTGLLRRCVFSRVLCAPVPRAGRRDWPPARLAALERHERWPLGRGTAQAGAAIGPRERRRRGLGRAGDWTGRAWRSGIWARAGWRKRKTWAGEKEKRCGRQVGEEERWMEEGVSVLYCTTSSPPARG